MTNGMSSPPLQQRTLESGDFTAGLFTDVIQPTFEGDTLSTRPGSLSDLGMDDWDSFLRLIGGMDAAMPEERTSDC